MSLPLGVLRDNVVRQRRLVRSHGIVALIVLGRVVGQSPTRVVAAEGSFLINAYEGRRHLVKSRRVVDE